MTFKREDRYIVIKLKSLTEDQIDSLETRMDNQGIVPLENCLVIEDDWPEYDWAWASIEERAK